MRRTQPPPVLRQSQKEFTIHKCDYHDMGDQRAASRENKPWRREKRIAKMRKVKFRRPTKHHKQDNMHQAADIVVETIDDDY